MKMAELFCRCQKIKLAAFSLLECLVALFVLSGSILVYQGLTKSVSANVHYLSDNDNGNWLLFSQQLRSELETSHLDKVENNKLYVTKSGQTLAFGQSKADDFRKTNADGRGYQPMLYGLKSSAISQKENMIQINLTFKNGLERSLIYAFEEAV
ncbi:competence type IV pilus minor pilin ComGF [Streptococcus orisratti]|uniref:competence type IV pilus minor pilin ComGF n=1 Tax=Streptococcus orisratti TaxID=114652 RepID=UPI000360E9A5